MSVLKGQFEEMVKETYNSKLAEARESAMNGDVRFDSGLLCNILPYVRRLEEAKRFREKHSFEEDTETIAAIHDVAKTYVTSNLADHIGDLRAQDIIGGVHQIVGHLGLYQNEKLTEAETKLKGALQSKLEGYLDSSEELAKEGKYLLDQNTTGVDRIPFYSVLNNALKMNKYFTNLDLNKDWAKQIYHEGKLNVALNLSRKMSKFSTNEMNRVKDIMKLLDL